MTEPENAAGQSRRDETGPYTYGEVAYRKYYEVREGLAWDGHPMPTWEELGPREQGQGIMDAWEAGTIQAITVFCKDHGVWDMVNRTWAGGLYSPIEEGE